MPIAPLAPATKTFMSCSFIDHDARVCLADTGRRANVTDDERARPDQRPAGTAAVTSTSSTAPGRNSRLTWTVVLAGWGPAK